MNPKAKPNLLVDQLLDETIVYDLERHRAHCLNAMAGFLLRSADGTRSVAELGRLAVREFGGEAPDEVVGVGLERLHKAKLLDWDSAPAGADRLTRRDTLKKIAAVGILLPTVMTLVSPHPAQAATGLPVGGCSGPADVGNCCSNNKLCTNTPTGYKCQGKKC